MEKHINLSDAREAPEVENIMLGLARQLKDKDQVAKLIDEGHDRILALLDRDKNTVKMRLTYEISSLRVAHMAELDLEKYMDVLEQDFDQICAQEAPEKYYFLKDIFMLLQDFPVISREFYDRYRKMFDNAARYIAEEAQADMKRYLEDLHEDAIYAYGNTLTEIVWISRYGTEYDFRKVYDAVWSICDTYERQGLFVEAMTKRLVLVREAITAVNVDRNFDLKWADLLKAALDKAGEMAEHIKLHPGYAETFFDLAYGYLRIHAYEKCLYFYQKCQ